MAEPFQVPSLGSRRVELEPLQPRTVGPTNAPTTGKPFDQVLSEAIGEVQRLQTEADSTIKQLVAGEIKDVSDAIIAVEKADVAFQTMMVVRNKIVAAYEEIMRMQV
jgi:flagellar hook-basal body complex protein FliE